MVFGSAALYRLDSVRVLKNRGSLYTNNASVRKGLNDTAALRFDFYVTAAKSYIYFNQQTQTDSLEIIWETKTGRCCQHEETYESVGTVRFNGAVVQPQKGTYVFVKP